MDFLSSRLYFAYGSSLSLSGMQSHCPTSTFCSIAVLRNHRWFVNERGYANIVPSVPGQKGVEDVVWGVLYTLRPFDEELLDKQEGIPWAYSKEDMDVEAVSIAEDGRGTRREVVRALVYIDRERVQESYPWPDFVVKMNKGIQDAVERGMPRTWVDKVVRSYIVADPSVVNGTEGQAENDGVTPTLDGPRSVPTTKPESDRASHTQGSVVGAQSVNGTPQPPKSNNLPVHSSGLDKSKYAYEGSTSDVQQGIAGNERDQNATSKKHINAGAQSQGNKQIECWWWKVKGVCRFSDKQCTYAHHITGVVSDAPGKKKKGTLLDEKKAPAQPKNFPRRAKSPSKAAKQHNQHPYGYPQDWSGQQGKAAQLSAASNAQQPNNAGWPHASWGEEQPKAEQPNAPSGTNQPKAEQPNTSWVGEQPKAEVANPSWSDQVENLMDSQPEWLVANARTDIKW